MKKPTIRIGYPIPFANDVSNQDPEMTRRQTSDPRTATEYVPLVIAQITFFASTAHPEYIVTHGYNTGTIMKTSH